MPAVVNSPLSQFGAGSMAANADEAAPLGRCMLAIAIAMQQDTPNALHDPTTYSRLLCVNKQLREMLSGSAVGRLVMCISVGRKSTEKFRYAFAGVEDGPDFYKFNESSPGFCSDNKLAWLRGQWQHHTIRQLHVEGIPLGALEASPTELLHGKVELDARAGILPGTLRALECCCHVAGSYGEHSTFPWFWLAVYVGHLRAPCWLLPQPSSWLHAALTG